ncbi:hypothetical protein PFMG_00936 [Plasmodium falciparum IGH-CR14]|uniref:Uncharacterized protein n=1 Tax=Plasmodium falciparum IGH-CR14 TaxID=580059 RepID=A0A0L1I554_PLAFA|nr:hypothetical protein PFMG_00936 [Plasmodium falciparum IGH-CR14]
MVSKKEARFYLSNHLDNINSAIFYEENKGLLKLWDIIHDTSITKWNVNNFIFVKPYRINNDHIVTPIKHDRDIAIYDIKIKQENRYKQVENVELIYINSESNNNNNNNCFGYNKVGAINKNKLSYTKIQMMIPNFLETFFLNNMNNTVLCYHINNNNYVVSINNNVLYHIIIGKDQKFYTKNIFIKFLDFF